MEAWRRFLLRRVARIYPMYLVALLVCMALALLAYGRFDPNRGGFAFIIDDPRTDILFNLLLVQGWGIARSALVPAWSISTEMAAYVLFPVFVFLTLKRGVWLTLLTCLGAVALLIVMVGLNASDGQVHGGPMDASQGQLPAALLRCFAGFALGMATFRLAQWWPAGPLQDDRLGMPLLAGLALTWIFAPTDYWIYPFFPLLVLVLAGNKGRVAALFSGRLVHGLGVLSYSIYLLHYQFAGVIHWIENALLLRMPAALAYPLAGMAVYGSLLVLAYLSFRWVELPGRQLIRRLAENRAPMRPRGDIPLSPGAV
jgi:peptidoglycan/LPS O-acetylase OafA/YrhL